MLTSNVENPPPVQNNNDTDTDHDEDPDIAEMERMTALQEEHDREDEDGVHLRTKQISLMSTSAHTNPTTQMHERMKRINRCDCECDCGRNQFLKCMVSLTYRTVCIPSFGSRSECFHHVLI